MNWLVKAYYTRTARDKRQQFEINLNLFYQDSKQNIFYGINIRLIFKIKAWKYLLYLLQRHRSVCSTQALCSTAALIWVASIELVDQQRWAPLRFKGAALPLPLQFPKWSGAPAPAPAPEKKERCSSCRSFIVLDVYKKVNVIILLQAQQIKSKCQTFFTKYGGRIDKRH